MNRKIIYPALLLALSAPVNAADMNKVQSIRKYVIEHGQYTERYDTDVPCKLYQLVLYGHQIGVTPPNKFGSGIVYKSPFDPSKNPKLESSEVTFFTLVCERPIAENLIVGAIDTFETKDQSKILESTIMRDGSSYEKKLDGIKLDGVVDTASERRSHIKPPQTGLEKKFTHVDLTDTKSRNRIQSMYDKIISGAYNKLIKK